MCVVSTVKYILVNSWRRLTPPGILSSVACTYGRQLGREVTPGEIHGEELRGTQESDPREIFGHNIGSLMGSGKVNKGVRNCLLEVVMPDEDVFANKSATKGCNNEKSQFFVDKEGKWSFSNEFHAE